MILERGQWLNNMNIINELKTLQRYRHRIIDNDDYIDDFPQECDYGPYIMWSDIKLMLDELEAHQITHSQKPAPDVPKPAGPISVCK